MTLAAHWPRAAAGRSVAPTRRKIQLFLKILKNCRIEDLKERNNFHTFGQGQFGLETPQFHQKSVRTLEMGELQFDLQNHSMLQLMLGLCSRPQEEAMGGGN